MDDNAQTNQFPLRFFGLAFAFAVPFWVVGGSKLPLPVNLPVSALTAFVPVTAAAVLVARQSGLTGVKTLFARALDFRRMGRKTGVLTLALPVAIYSASYLIMRLVGLPLPDTIKIPPQAVPVFAALYLVTAAGEELGWTAYATDRMQGRNGLLLGILWASWHVIPFVQTGNPLTWVAWQSLKTVAMRMLLVWFYNRSGKSVSPTIIYHAVDNVCWSMFPNNGSHYDPMVTSLVTCLALAIMSTVSPTQARKAAKGA
jgi:hypothetical protein